MSMLAEPRSRQKWSHDPRNTNWSNDKTKFGYTMLTKMGWSEGNGLGANLSGNTSHIKVNKRGSNAGIGLKKSHEDDWIGHQDDFNALLNSLNGKPAAETTAAPVEKMRATKHRYTKFVKSKDLSNASTDDLACIFGQRTAKDEKKDSDSSETESTPEEEELNVKTIESTLSVNDYFAKKMAALKQKNMLANSPICTSNVSKNFVSSEKPSADVEDNNITCPDEQPCEPEKKKKKKKKSKDSDEGDTPCVETKIEDPSLLTDSEIVKKKKKKKSKEMEISEDNTNPFSPCSDIKTDSNELPEDVSEGKTKKKKKKKNKENMEETCVEVNKESADVVLENGLVKKKKKRKRTEASDVIQNSENQTEEVVKKKKKKKTKEVCNAE